MNAQEKLKQIRKMLFGEEKTFAEATLKDGTVIKWEGELAEGVAVMAITADGEVPAPDGNHQLEDGTIVTTVGGLVTEIEAPQSEDFAAKIKPFEDRIASMENSLKELLEVATKSNESFEAVKKENSELTKKLTETEKVNGVILETLEKFSKAVSEKQTEPAKKVFKSDNPIENEILALSNQLSKK